MANRSKILFCLLIILLNIYFIYLARSFLLDDALIYYRYIRNLFDGYGLVYNIGEYYNALTSPLYTFISVVFAAIFIDIEFSQLILYFILTCSIQYFLYSIFQEYISGNFSILIPLFYLSHIFFYYTIGLETSLLVLLIIVSIYFLKNKKDDYLLISLSLLFITRFDSAIFIATIIVFRVLEKRNISLKIRTYLFASIIIFAPFIFNYLYYGQPLPGSIFAKMYHAESGLWHHFGMIPYHLGMIFFGNPIFMIFIIFISIFSLILNWDIKELRILSIFVFLYTVILIFKNIPNYHWYYAPNYLLITILLFLGFLRNKNTNISDKFKFTLVLLFLSFTFFKTHQKLPDFRPNNDYYLIAHWVKNNTPEGSSLAASEIGVLGYFSNRKIIDLVGLVNEGIAETLVSKEYNRIYEKFKPDYVLIHKTPFTNQAEILNQVKRGEYILEAEFINEIDGKKLNTDYQIYRIVK